MSTSNSKNARGPHPNEVTRNFLWARAAGRCQFKNCQKPLDYDLVAGNPNRNSAYIAHIVASSPGGERGDEILSHQLSDKLSNLMLLCDTHHREIDDEKNIEKYPIELLRQWKREHEEWVNFALSGGMGNSSHIMQFSAPIGPNETAVPFEDCVQAILPEKSPADLRPIEIKVRGIGHSDTDKNYWSTELAVLRDRFARDVLGRFEKGEIGHLSVFGLAPIPLLMELGRLISDISHADIYQLHREPPQWQWAEDGQEISFTFNHEIRDRKIVALKIATTSEITDDRIFSVLGKNASIWQINSDQYGNDIIRHRNDLSRFRQIVRSTLDEIKNIHGMDVEVCVFPATSVSCAIEFGRVWQPKAHPILKIYDQTRDNWFVHRLSFGSRD